MAAMKREAGERGGDLSLVPQVFRYGIQYRPTAESLRNTYMQGTKRTIVFYNLPEEVPICRVLAHVRGGMLTKVTKCKTNAMVEFYLEKDAKQYVDFAGVQNIAARLGPNVVIEHLMTDTYPLAPLSANQIAHAMTRCIGIRDFHRDDLHRFCGQVMKPHWARPQDMLEDMWIGRDRHMYLLCLGFRSAISLWLRLKDIGGVAIFKASDPCAKPIEANDLGCLARGYEQSLMYVWETL